MSAVVDNSKLLETGDYVRELIVNWLDTLDHYQELVVLHESDIGEGYLRGAICELKISIRKMLNILERLGREELAPVGALIIRHEAEQEHETAISHL